MSELKKTLVQERLLTTFVKNHLSIEDVQLLVSRLNRINDTRIEKRDKERLEAEMKAKTIESYDSILKKDGLSLDDLVLYLKKK